MKRRSIFCVALIVTVSSATFGSRCLGVPLVSKLASAAGYVSADRAAAGEPQAQQCQVNILVTNVRLIRRLPGGGHEVQVDWRASAPSCFDFSKFEVSVVLTLAKGAHQQATISVPGNQRTATVEVRGLVTDGDAKDFNATVTGMAVATPLNGTGSNNGQF